MDNRNRIFEVLEILRLGKKIKMTEIISELKSRYNRTSERKSIYKDIKALEKAGYTIRYSGGDWCLESGAIQYPIAKIIVDAVNAYRCTDAQREQVLKAVIRLFPNGDAEKLASRDVRFPRRKDDDIEILEHQKKMDAIFTARRLGGKVLFRYRGKSHLVAPQIITWDGTGYGFRAAGDIVIYPVADAENVKMIKGAEKE